MTYYNLLLFFLNRSKQESPDHTQRQPIKSQ